MEDLGEHSLQLFRSIVDYFVCVLLRLLDTLSEVILQWFIVITGPRESIIQERAEDMQKALDVVNSGLAAPCASISAAVHLVA